MSDERAPLVKQIDALLDLDAKNALAPHGLGGHARELLIRSRRALSGGSDELVARLGRQTDEWADRINEQLIAERDAAIAKLAEAINALHIAISVPKGVVLDAALPFYGPEKYPLLATPSEAAHTHQET